MLTIIEKIMEMMNPIIEKMNEPTKTFIEKNDCRIDAIDEELKQNGLSEERQKSLKEDRAFYYGEQKDELNANKTWWQNMTISIGLIIIGILACLGIDLKKDVD